MPSTATITAFNVFSTGTVIRSAKMNENFQNFRGHILPTNTDSASASNISHDLGSDEHRWRGGYFQFLDFYSTSTAVANPTAGAFRFYTKGDSKFYSKNSAGTESALGGGGGGGGLQWSPGANAPTEADENNTHVFRFGYSLSQEIYTSLAVPTSYAPGTQINLKLAYYADDTVGTGKIETLTTLIRSGDLITSTTNQYTSTAAAVSCTANKVVKTTLDLTNANGLINAVTVSAGDILIIKVLRPTTDTSTLELAAMLWAAEPTFT